MGDISVTANLVGRIHNDHAHFLRKHARHFAQHRGLANAGPAEQQEALARAHNVLNNLDCSIDGPANAARQPNDVTPAIADR